MSATDYAAFLQTKQQWNMHTGFPCLPEDLPAALFPWQRVITAWALRKGRAAIFAGTGLGKTVMQLAWAQHIPGRVLIFAPLMVAQQTIAEAHDKLGMRVQYVQNAQSMDDDGVYITNYDRMEHFTGEQLAGIVCDESSILKSITSKTRAYLIETFAAVPYRLCCTATPAPNDIAELANHAEFLGIMKRTDMLANFFTHDDDWRLKRYARQAFYQWCASWAIALNNPSDIGFDGQAWELPAKRTQTHFQKTGWKKEGWLLPSVELGGIGDRLDVRRSTVEQRVQLAAQLAMETVGQVVIWCGLNPESTAIARLLGDEAIEITGSQKAEEKERRMGLFLSGVKRILVSKSSICGFGINLQCAATAIFLGLNDSWESWYQAVRRIWRYGQKQEVTIHVVMAEEERVVWDNIQSKEQEAVSMITELIDNMRIYEAEALQPTIAPSHDAGVIPYQESAAQTETFYTLLGDNCETIQQIATNSIGLTVTSPPFIALYQYSDTPRDIGNCRTEAEFFAHFRFVMAEVLRVTMPGRLCAMHVSQVPAMLVRDGWIGLKDFRGHLVDHMVELGWIYHGEITVDKNPQVQAVRTKAKGLMFAQKARDSAWLRPGLADYVVVFRKPGENAVPLHAEDVSNNDWITWAHPVWHGIRETRTLNAAEGRSEDDERHICPLQLDLIERCVKLWSGKGEQVLDPFAGIGSTGYVALRHDRRFIGLELKPNYYEVMLKNLDMALGDRDQLALNL